jgi:hypothetical protein
MVVYEIINKDGIYEEVTHEQWLKIIGDDDTWLFAHNIYRGRATLGDVPEQYREAVAKVVAARVEFCGEYRLPAAVALAELMEVFNETQ